MLTPRRQFLKAVAAAAAVTPLPFSALAAGRTRREDQLRVAAIGFGGQGKSDLDSLRSHPAFQLTAACDVDRTFFPTAEEIGGKVPLFQDYRQLFGSAADDFDAVLIATPDHMHAPIAMMALDADKHVYLQKPLAQDIGECRALAEAAAAKPELATQMGIQIHGHPAYRTAVEWIQAGVIGPVNEVHSWSGKGWGGEVPPKDPVAPPANLDWDLYLGVAAERPYVEGWYHRGNWRKWFAFGTGTQGDMGCHILDPVFTALQLTQPLSARSLGPKPFAENFALISQVEHQFRGTNFTTPELTLTWYNGELRPKELAGIPESITLPDQGSVLIGEKGSLILPHIGDPQVFQPDGTPMADLPPKASAVNHYHEWIDVALGKQDTTGAPFGYAGPLTEAVLLGTVINRWPNVLFEWDAEECQFRGEGADVAAANALLQPAYRTGW